MDFEKIYDECTAVLENHVMDSLLFYFDNYRSQRKEFAKNFKQAFCSLVDDVVSDLEREEAENDI